MQCAWWGWRGAYGVDRRWGEADGVDTVRRDHRHATDPRDCAEGSTAREGGGGYEERARLCRGGDLRRDAQRFSGMHGKLS